ncbi:AzlC family ABC transporter permease [Staphylococcus sp. 18_1_E_LY]|uniref:AzlC family ABC transporter permease n=1 Tax=Staphylococcus lloydii TaxID=2781774 RepID=A0A7T1AZV7_9STAP|nr:AzlC family ABC transporter permease [Staphylococcus lloydii]MBF7019798.1 AzlC family ABC transporter permease [Staphylococcus lloydii]MBF7027526.1 AzlC family ABC transporter permease [Staphylococcus lloydii]MDU9418850.1 AzlC family ABC transporter permease [Staphylococcus lloydii]QPM75179.1 AzlC family ABC transporter permease [Staphylococcus lloydii]
MASHLTFRQGVKECVPTLLGYAGVGLSFGIVAVASKFSLLEIVLLCLLVYAGAAQFIICSLVIAGTPITAIVLTTFIVNSRMFLLSMTLAPQYKDYGWLNRLGLATLVTDETFGVAITPHLKGEKINDRWLHGLNLTAYLFWTVSCIVGAIFGKYIHNPDALGLDFAITGMFIFLAISQFETVQRSQIMTYIVLIVCVIVMMFLFSLFMPTYVAIILSSILAATLGVVMTK